MTSPFYVKESLLARGLEFPFHDRVRQPADTVALMRPRFPEFGITRLARVTGLDHIGIPVWSAIRPNSKTLAVSQGKGLDDAAAQASAVMEAIEVATAERLDLPHRFCQASALVAEGAAVCELPSLLRKGEKAPRSDEASRWVEGYDLVKNQPIWVPLEAVTLSEQRSPTRYWQSTDGLASGNVLWEAILHGICERVERDALALWSFRSDNWVADHCVDIDHFNDATLNRLAALIAKAGLQVRIFDIGSDTEIPAYLATLSLPSNGHEAKWKHFDLASGSGCHPDPVRAVFRAVTEAAQTRLTTISAIRDDFDPLQYEAKLNADLLPYIRVTPKVKPLCSIGAELQQAEYLSHIVGRLISVGVRSIIVVPLESQDKDFAVVKIIIPDLENLPGDRRFAHGPRAVRLMLAHS